MSPESKSQPIEMHAEGPVLDRFFNAVYAELKQSARRMRAGTDASDTLHTTQLVHELYLRMRKTEAADFPSQAQFFGYAARAMRTIIIDHARQRTHALKRDAALIDMQTILDGAKEMASESALALDAALKKLAQEDSRAALVVEMHFFLQLPLTEIAQHLGLTTRTIDRDWRFARAYLQASMPPT